ncbi:hypothetical protein FOMG_19963 [Fusarium oxysporum f. sp. melonis 26406]|uniref:Uncharacterized protein n=1 Tax=Fusarium oxysporum f. sp. melonis 26406 TaxID=1089452 RepID=W9Z4R7_FUSOX|nr:hypothetical protein FOMG_19963 [Fusarium oxysporum f. sp. melonis 26406]
MNTTITSDHGAKLPEICINDGVICITTVIERTYHETPSNNDCTEKEGTGEREEFMAVVRLSLIKLPFIELLQTSGRQLVRHFGIMSKL